MQHLLQKENKGSKSLPSKIQDLEKKILGLSLTIDQLSKDFAQMRMDLKSANIIQDEEYVPPAVDELTARDQAPTPKKKSKIEQISEDSDPFA